MSQWHTIADSAVFKFKPESLEQVQLPPVTGPQAAAAASGYFLGLTSNSEPESQADSRARAEPPPPSRSPAI